MTDLSSGILYVTNDISWQTQFEDLLPVLRKTIIRQIRKIQTHEPDELEHEAICIALKMFRSIVERQIHKAISIHSLAKFGVLHAFRGRNFGSGQKSNDLFSRSCQQKNGLRVVSLNQEQKATQMLWQHQITDNSRTPIPEQVAFRLDFQTWYATLSKRYQEIIQCLISREPIHSIGQRFDLSSGRISQIRKELNLRWDQFHEQAYEAMI